MNLKKVFFCISFVLVMFLSITNVNAADNVMIKSVELVDKSVNTTETSDATFNGLTMNFDLKFTNVNDYAKYKVTVENKENKDYKILIDSNFDNSKYIAYDYVKADSLKANSDTEFYVTVSYKNEVSEDSFSDGKYSEKNSAVLKLDDGSVSNPITSNNEAILIIGLLIITIGLIVLFKSKTNKNISFIVLFVALSIPLFVKAVDSLKITVNSNIEIEKGYRVDYEVDGFIKTSEIDNYDLSYASCHNYVYVGSISEENKYLNCYDAIYKGKRLYASSDSVNISDNLPPLYNFNYDNCKYTDGSSLDNWDDTKDILCPSVENADFDYDYMYMYSISYSKNFGYQIYDDENNIMKFTNADDEWNSYQRIFIYSDSKFIMPSHNVLFNLFYES